VADGTLTGAKLTTPLDLSSTVLTAPKIASGGFIADANGNEQIKFTTTTSAVNELTITNAATGNAPSVATTGSDTNISLTIAPKGTGQIIVNAGAVGTPTIAPTGDTNTGIYFPSADTIAFTEGGAEAMRIDSSGNVGIGTSPSTRLHTLTSSGENKLTVEASAASQSAVVSLVTNATTPGQAILYMGKSGASTHGQVGYDPNNNFLYFYTNNAERMRIDTSGKIYVNRSTDIYMSAFSSKNLILDGGSDAGELCITCSKGSASTMYHIGFFNANSAVGSISTSGYTTSYNTSSDYRLKENVNYNFDATTRLKQLKPARFNFITEPNKTVDGFLAHEVSDIVPEAIVGTKDQTVTKEKVVLNVYGNIIAENIEKADWEAGKIPFKQADWEAGKIPNEEGKSLYSVDTTWEASKVVPVYQGIDQAKLTPLLTKALQETIEKIESLEARLTTLENKKWPT
jgi:hypothetical protein